MKLGLVSAILADKSFEETIDFIADAGLECVELACWPKEKAERRYAGVTHLDVVNLSDSEISYISNYCQKRKVRISALAYYPNVLDADPERQKCAVLHLKRVIKAAMQMKVGVVTTFIGRDQRKTVEENLILCQEVWPDIMSWAEECGVKIAIENCPMLFDENQWPGGQNLATTPALWKEIFERVPSSYLGLNYDPSHFVWQMMDYISPIYEFQDKIFHVHFKDIKLYKERLDRVGTMAYPLQYMSPKLPGRGDVDWELFVRALKDTGFQGSACLEIEDKDFEQNHELVKKAVLLSKDYVQKYL